VGAWNEMDVESVGSNSGAYFGRGRCESGVKWWGSDVETTSDIAH